MPESPTANRFRRPLAIVSTVVAAGLVTVLVVVRVQDVVAAVTVAGLVVAIATLGVQIASHLGARSRPRQSPDALADDLAQTIREQWLDEARARRLRHPWVLPLTWTETHRPANGGPSGPVAVTGMAPSARVVRLRLDGRLQGRFEQVTGQLAAAYQQVPTGRLVLLGEPGAGKTVLAFLLTLGLLDARTAGGRVPVVLSAASWDPLREEFDRWIVRTLAMSNYGGRPEIPERLLRNDLLMPVVDGLDEIPETARRSAVAAINQAIKERDLAVVVTCRSAEYQDLIDGGAPVLRRVPVVEVQRVEVEDVIAYLSALDWPDGVVWEPVYAHLRERPDSPVANALSTPLMVSLARLIFQRLDVKPVELLDPERFDSRHAIEDFLVDGVIDAAYAPEPTAGEAEPRRARWDAVRARRWLTYLASYLHQHRERDLAWWLLSQRLLSPWVAPGIGIGLGVVLMTAVAAWVAVLDAGALVGLNNTLVTGAGAGGLGAVFAMVIWYAGAGRPPGRLSLTLRGSVRRLLRGFLTGVMLSGLVLVPVLAGAAVTISITDVWTLFNIEAYARALVGAAVLAVVVGVALSAHNWLDAPPRRSAHDSPRALVRQDRRSSVVGALVAGAVVSAFAFLAVIGGTTTGSVTSKALTGWSGWPGSGDVASMLDAGVYDATDGFFATRPMMYGGAVLLPGAAFALLLLLTRAWPRFGLARVLLALRGHLPWRLLGFLADARERELLRQLGGTYQFRHIRLQERLANQALAGWSAAARGPVPAARPVRRRRWALALGAAGAAVLLAGVPLAALPVNNARAALPGRHAGGVYEAEFSPDGSLVATSNRYDDVVRLWEVATGRLVAALPGHAGGPSLLRFSPDSRALATGDGNVDDRTYRMRLWETVNGTLVPMRTPKEASDIEWASGGRAVVTDDESARLVEVSTGRVLATQGGRMLDTLEAEPDSGIRIAVMVDDEGTPDRGDDRAMLWDLTTGRVSAELGPGVEFAWFSPDGSTLITGRRAPDSDNYFGARLWHVATGNLLAVLDPEPGGLAWIRYSDDGRVVLTEDDAGTYQAGDDTLQAWDTATGRPLRAVRGDSGELSYATFDPRGRLLLGADDEAVRFWNPRTGETSVIRPPHGIRMTSFSPDVRVLATVGENADAAVVRLWDVGTGRALFTLPGTAVVGSLTFSDDGRLLASNSGASLALWEVATGRLLARVPLLPSESMQRFGPDGRTVVTREAVETTVADLFGGLEVEPATVRVWQVSTARLLAEIPAIPAGGGLEGYTFTPDGRVLATIDMGDDRVRLWDVVTGRLLSTLTGHAGPVLAVQFSPDGSTIATSGTDNTVRLWDVPPR